MEEQVAHDEKIASTDTASHKETLTELRGLVKEVDADAWMYAKQRHAMR
ncbi:hypothetical protein N9L76_04535 [bacterium]|nr:hypothetical protein [bacterium]